MERKRSRIFVKIIAVIVALSLCGPIGAQAAKPDTVEPMASAYLAAYNSYICAMGEGKLEIWFRVIGTGTWADIGVLDIFLYESTDNVNWTWIKTFQFTDYEDETMLAHDTFSHMSHVDYDGVPGRYYKAYVCIWAGPEDGGDARYIWTPVERCT